MFRRPKEKASNLDFLMGKKLPGNQSCLVGAPVPSLNKWSSYRTHAYFVYDSLQELHLQLGRVENL